MVIWGFVLICQIYWSKRLKTVSIHLQTLQEMRKTVSGLRTSYQLTNLDPDTTYFIQVMEYFHNLSCVYSINHYYFILLYPSFTGLIHAKSDKLQIFV